MICGDASSAMYESLLGFAAVAWPKHPIDRKTGMMGGLADGRSLQIVEQNADVVVTAKPVSERRRGQWAVPGLPLSKPDSLHSGIMAYFDDGCVDLHTNGCLETPNVSQFIQTHTTLMKALQWLVEAMLDLSTEETRDFVAAIAAECKGYFRGWSCCHPKKDGAVVFKHLSQQAVEISFNEKNLIEIEFNNYQAKHLEAMKTTLTTEEYRRFVPLLVDERILRFAAPTSFVDMLLLHRAFTAILRSVAADAT